MKSYELLLNFMKSCKIMWIYQIQQISVQIWWTSGGFHIMLILFRFTRGFNVDYIMDCIVDFTCRFYGFHMKSTWFHMKDQEKVKNLTWISCSYWFQVDFMKSAKFHNEICQISWWNLLDFMVKSTGFHGEICRISFLKSLIRGRGAPKTTCQLW